MASREQINKVVVEPLLEMGRELGFVAAKSGGVTQLHRVIDLVNSGATPERIKQWCEQQIAKRREDR